MVNSFKTYFKALLQYYARVFLNNHIQSLSLSFVQIALETPYTQQS